MSETPKGLLPLIARAERLSGDLLENRLARFGLSYAQFRLLGHLLGETEGLTQKALAARMRLDPSGISVALGPLEKRGLVKRVRDPNDRRNVRVHLSADCAQMRAVLAEVAALEAVIRKVLGEARYDALAEALPRLIAALERQPDTPALSPSKGDR